MQVIELTTERGPNLTALCACKPCLGIYLAPFLTPMAEYAEAEKRLHHEALLDSAARVTHGDCGFHFQ